MASPGLQGLPAANTIEALSSLQNGLQVTWPDGFTSFFHYLWLRDCCYCATCGDSYSSKRYIVPSDIPLNITPQRAEIDANGGLAITWSDDAHRSSYAAQWLRDNCYDAASLTARFQQPLLWDAKLSGQHPRVAFDEAKRSDEARMELYRKLRDYGFVVITDGPSEPGSIAEVAGLVGDLGGSSYTTIFDLTPKSKVRTIGNSMRPVPPHTDEAFRHSPPGVNILGCLRPADDGGESVLTDGFNLANILRNQYPQSFDMLARYAQSYHRVHDSDDEGVVDERTRQPMIKLDDRGEVVGVRIHTRAAAPMTLPADIVEAYYAAHHRLSELMMSPDNQVRFLLNAGDTAIFDNHRVLHARADFTDPERFMQICNVPRESFHERLRLLARKLGHHHEAHMILCSGV